MSRQSTRLEIFESQFNKYRMTGIQKHSYRPTLGFDDAGKRIYGPRVVDFEVRAARRNAARAFAAAECKSRKI